MPVYNYPAPRAPEYKQPTSIEDCLPQARAIVKKLGASERPFSGRELLWIREGDRVLIVTLPDQDKYVAEAVEQAIMEQGAEKVTWVYPRELVGIDPKTYSLEDGWREIELYKEGKASGAGVDYVTGLDLGTGVRKYLDNNPEYTAVFIDVLSGGAPNMGEHRSKARGTWAYSNWEWFLARGHRFPLEVWREFERRLMEPLSKASQVRITDPEGTHLEFSLTAEEAERWHLGAKRGFQHLSFNPLMATSQDKKEGQQGEPVEAPMVFPKVTGVLAGTANHCGYIPRMETYFEHDRLVEVKGGGRYGDGIMELMEKHRDIHWPHYPDKGLFWFADTALCTAIGTHRRTSDMFNSYWLYPNLPERTAPGVFHHGFGTRVSRTEKEFGDFAEKHNIPLFRGHIHGGHNYFSTFEVKLRGTNYWLKLVDKGWIIALGDPEVRALAAKYGVPDELLNYDWIPPIPGINCEGDYLKDYAPDPAAYLKKRMKENKPI